MKSPAFRFYPADFMGSPDVQAMDLEEVGAYMFLLCMAWQSERHGYLEDNEDRLRRLARMSPEQWTRSRDQLLKKFPIVEPGWRANARMVREAEKQQSFSESQSAKGKRGGRPRKAGEKLGVHNEKPGVSSGLSPEKPSVSVSASASASVVAFESASEDKSISLALQAHPDVVLGEAEKHHDLLIYEAYPRKEGKGAALKAIQKAIQRLVKGEHPRLPMTKLEAQRMLMRKVLEYARSSAGNQSDKTKIPHPATWFNQSRYDDDPQNWNHVTLGGFTNGRQRNFTDIADSSRGALELLAGMDTPAYLGGGSPQTGTAIGQIHEGSHGSTLATDAQRDR